MFEGFCVHGEAQIELEVGSEGSAIRFDMSNHLGDLEGLVVQAVELVQTMIGVRDKATRASVSQTLSPVVGCIMGLLQVTAAQIETWELDPNQYVADEDDDSMECNVRNSCLDVLMALVDMYGPPCLDAVVGAHQSILAAAMERCEGGDEEWWRPVEASLLSIGTIAEEITEAAGDGIDINSIVGGMVDLLVEAVSSGDSPPLLKGRALWCAGRYVTGIPAEASAGFFAAAVQALGDDSPLPVRISACRSVALLMPTLTKAAPEALQVRGECGDYRFRCVCMSCIVMCIETTQCRTPIQIMGEQRGQSPGAKGHQRRQWMYYCHQHFSPDCLHCPNISLPRTILYFFSKYLFVNTQSNPHRCLFLSPLITGAFGRRGQSCVFNPRLHLPGDGPPCPRNAPRRVQACARRCRRRGGGERVSDPDIDVGDLCKRPARVTGHRRRISLHASLAPVRRQP